MPRPALVQFPAFRHHEASRESANNAMMALLVGAQVSAQFLELTRDSPRQLSEIFPSIPHVERFDLRPSDAQNILRGAEEHLGAMAVPQALAIHEGFILDCLELLNAGSAKAWEMHDKLAMHAGGTFDADRMSRFHVLREMRNAIIHRSGIVNQRLIDKINDLTPAGENEWCKHTGRSPRRLKIGDRVTFMLGELVEALATTKALAREANWLLIPAVPSSKWAEVIIDDHLQHTAGQLNPTKRRKAVMGFCRHNYRAVTVAEADLKAAASTRGIDMA
ncbi:hypothetical protein [Lentzea sp. NBRC 102530]|uniref:hypothetical protein n=1 Tax=Lentzea sp. NBRC 102530 TaxID=3032201 RepID=UPI0024A5BD5A|nr:hypothetical protein [Lentzea sp. NBRC 102530]GLY52164.1 hypothetical protein Lesp01_58200 [Lentzea sp. NBRC 102530]